MCLYAGLVGDQSAVDLVRDPSAQEAQRFGLRISGFHPTLHVCLANSQTTPLSDGDPVECGVHLTISAAIEPMPRSIRRPDGNRCGAIPSSECCPRTEAFGASHFSDDLGR